MNAKRKEQIAKLAAELYEITSQLETILAEEQEYFDNIPENMQSGERYEASESAIDRLESVISDGKQSYDELTEIF